MRIKTKRQAFFIVFIFFFVFVSDHAQENQSVIPEQLKDTLMALYNTDNMRINKLKEEIQAEYESRGESGVRDFVKERRNEITLPLIVEIADSAFTGKNEQWLKISLILTEEKKNQTAVETWLAMTTVYKTDISTNIMKYLLYDTLHVVTQFGVCMSLQSSERGLECLEDLISHLEKVDHPYAQEVLAILKTSIDAFKNDMNKMETVFDKELHSIKKTENLQQQGQIFLVKGAVHLNRGEYIRSLEMLEKALKFFEDAGDVESHGYVYMVWGTLYQFIGDNIRAFDMFEKALPLFKRSGALLEQCSVYGKKAVIYQTLGEELKAIEMYDNALQTIEKKGYDLQMGEIYFSKGHIYRKTGDWIKAREMYKRALDIFERDRETPGRRSVCEAKGTISLLNGSYREAIEMYGKAVPFYTEFEHRDKGYLYKSIGEIHFYTGSYAKAAAMYDLALQEQRKTGTSELLSHTLHMKAKTLEKLEKKQEASILYEEAIEKLEKIQRQTGIAWMKMKLMERFFEQYEEAAVFMLENKYDDKGFTCIEFMKARVFLDQLSEGLEKLEKGINQELMQKRDALVVKLSLLSKEMSEASMKKDEAQLNVLKDKYNKTELEFEDLLVKIRLENPLYVSVQYPEPISLNHLQQDILKKGEIILQYFVTNEKLYVFLVSKQDFHVVKLEITGKEINKMVDDYLKPSTQKLYQRNRNIPIIKRWLINHGKVLYESLFKPLEPELWGIKDIIIIPDGELAKIPFESFVVANKEQGKPVYLLEKYRIKYIQGASTLSILRKHYRRQNSSKHFIGFGDPVYDYENFQQGKPENGSPGTSKGDIVKEIHRDKYNREGGMYTRLPGSGQEVETIAELFKQQEQKSVVYLRESATEERAKSSDLREFDYIHFSCHGILGDGFQSLILSQTPGSKEDGYLTLNEIMNCDYQAKLVVLSACQTGTGKMERAEGVMGLTRAVMYAGTPAVVASLWNVSEMGTKELMVKFYTNMLEKGMNKEEDLRQAKLEMIKGNKYASPYFWSSFVMYGE